MLQLLVWKDGRQAAAELLRQCQQYSPRFEVRLGQPVQRILRHADDGHVLGVTCNSQRCVLHTTPHHLSSRAPWLHLAPFNLTDVVPRRAWPSLGCCMTLACIATGRRLPTPVMIAALDIYH